MRGAVGSSGKCLNAASANITLDTNLTGNRKEEPQGFTSGNRTGKFVCKPPPPPPPFQHLCMNAFVDKEARKQLHVQQYILNIYCTLYVQYTVTKFVDNY